MALEKGLLIRMPDDADAPSADDVRGYRESDAAGGDDWLRVHFNPESLKTSLSTSLKSSDRGSGRTTGQWIEKSESTLTLELVFDTSTRPPDVYRSGSGDQRTERLKHADVREITGRIATLFMTPADGSGGGGGGRSGNSGSGQRVPAPSRCHFRWGTFGFTGMVASMNETLDYFSPDGVPLRSTVSLTLKQDRFQFQRFEADIEGQRVRSALQAASGSNAAGGGTDQPSSQAVLADLNDPNETAGSRPRAG